MVLDVHVHEFAPDIFDQNAVERYKESVTGRMRRLIENTSAISGSYFFDAKGDMLYTSDRDAKPANVADRAFFKIVRDQPETRLVFSDALMARTTGRWSVVVARAVRNIDKKFIGVTTVLLDLEREKKLIDEFKLPGLAHTIPHNS